MIRLAKPTDSAAMLDIYSPYIENTSLTFETITPSIPDFTQRIENYLQLTPWLVADKDGKVAGFAYASKYRDRTAYQWSIECSIYVHDDFLHTGIGTELYSTLFRILKHQGFTTVYAVINLPNEPSVEFHEKMSFRHFATFEKVGFKLGQWKNVGWWQLQLNEYENEPYAPIHLKDLPPETISKLLKSVEGGLFQYPLPNQ